MMWKAIGQSAQGTSHMAGEKPCEDALQYSVTNADDGECLICCMSDGAGSAEFGGWAAAYTTREMVGALAARAGEPLAEADIYAIAEDIYAGLAAEAGARETGLPEFSCTMLGVYISEQQSVFFQVGDGAIVRNDGSGFYTPIWWPMNGEYQNTTTFLVDDTALSQLNVLVLNERVDEVAMFTDGLQLLTLNTETAAVHQPFFEPLFRYLRMANDDGKIAVLNRKLAEYLDSKAINDRTDDDKTLFLATRLV